jgi:hypothetical protein
MTKFLTTSILVLALLSSTLSLRMMGQFDTYQDSNEDDNQNLYDQQDSIASEASDQNLGLDQMKQYIKDDEVAGLAQNLNKMNGASALDNAQFYDPNYNWDQFGANGDDNDANDGNKDVLDGNIAFGDGDDNGSENNGSDNNGDYNYDQGGYSYGQSDQN